MVGWQMKQKPGLSRTQAERDTLAFMSKMPAWKNHPRVVAALAASDPFREPRATLIGMSEVARQLFTFRDYIDLEEISGVRHEFLSGHVWAMAGGSPDHARVAANVSALLIGQLRESRCAVFDSDLRVRVKATGLGTYPDVTVVCGSLELDPDDPKRHTVSNPKVIVEVLSPSTEEYDRGEKLDHYRQISSLEEVALVAHGRLRIDVWRRKGDGWVHLAAEGDGTAELTSIGCELPLPEVYRDPLAS